MLFKPAGYTTHQGFIGFLPDGSKMYFPTSDEYYEYVNEMNDLYGTLDGRTASMAV